MELSVSCSDDAVRVGAPSEGLGFGRFVLVGEAVDGGLKFDERAEDAALEAPLGQLGEEPFDGVDPGAAGRDEREGPAPMTREPSVHTRVFVGGVVVEDRVRGLPAGTARSISFRKRMNS